MIININASPLLHLKFEKWENKAKFRKKISCMELLVVLFVAACYGYRFRSCCSMWFRFRSSFICLSMCMMGMRNKNVVVKSKIIKNMALDLNYTVTELKK